jgi:catalase
VAGELCATDAERDVRGFAIRTTRRKSKNTIGEKHGRKD